MWATMRARGFTGHSLTPLDGWRPFIQDFAERRTVHRAPKKLMENLQEMMFHDPTPIQRQATTALMQGRELFAVAPTGAPRSLLAPPRIFLPLR